MSDGELSQMEKRVSLARCSTAPNVNNGSQSQCTASSNVRQPKCKPKFKPVQANARGVDNYQPNNRGVRNKVALGEVGSVYAPYRSRKADKGKHGNRGDNWMDDSFASRDEYEERITWKTPRTRYVSHSQGYNKEKFLLANCQFVVREGRDYKEHMLQADLLVQWDNVEELRIYSPEMCVCPICLFPPTAAQMTRCGHVFCYPCILHYLALSDKAWRKCPICYESVYGNQLKSVVALQVRKKEVGEYMEMQLMQRNKGTIMALPKDKFTEEKTLMCINDSMSRYAKMIVASVKDVREGILDREMTQLNVRLKEEEGEPQVCFVHQAIKLIDDRKELLIDAQSSNCETQINPTETNENTVENNDAEDTPQDNEGSNAVAQKSAPAAQNEPSEKNVISPCVSVHSLNDNSQSSPIERQYFFYQSCDGQPIYLHQINARCIIHEYGSLQEAPQIIKGKVLQMDYMTMTSQLRDRMRYLSHLPLKTNFVVMEIDLAKSILSKETRTHFADELAARKRERNKRIRSENKLSHKAEQWQNMAFISSASYSSDGRLPSPTDFALSTYVASAQTDIAQSWQSDEPQTTTYNQEMSESLSFAQMLRQGKPKVGGAAPPSTSRDMDDFPCPSTYQANFGDAIAEALDSVRNEENSRSQQSSGKSKKKKKNKGVVLFSI